MNDQRFENPLNTPWFESPFFEKMLKESSLDDSVKEIASSLAKDGVAVIDLEIADFDALAESIIGGLSNDLPTKGHHRVQDAWIQNESVKRLATLPRISQLLDAIYGRSSFPFQTLNFSTGTEQMTHSDTVHFNSSPERFMCGVWVALEDIDDDNGPLHYYPGSHKLPVWSLTDLGIPLDQKSYALYEKKVAQLMPEFGFSRREFNLRKGQAVIWAANLFHGGSPIRDMKRTRHSQVTHYYFENCLYYTPLLSDPIRGKVMLREPLDVRSRTLVKNGYFGQPASVALAQRLHLTYVEAYDFYRRTLRGR